MSHHLPGTLLSICLAAPFLGAMLSPLIYRVWKKGAILVPALSSIASFASLVLILRSLRDQPLLVSSVWIHDLPLSFSFRVDGFGGLFAALVAGIGVLIVWYAHFYLHGESGQGRFFSYLLMFFGAMVGLALSDHFFTTFLFWELTSVSSFLLIGFWHEREKSREGALKALFITSIGGLFLFAGLALLGVKTDVWTWSALGQIHPEVASQPWFAWSFLLILIGVFTKSAQFPFHIWLPDAMEAPTPVSAFLHSATMVKAGVFLLFRLHPLFSHSPLWVPLLTTVGMTTVLVGAVLALKHKDLKAILAYSTISQLGLFVAVHGYSGIDPSVGSALRAGFIFHIFAHAFYKGSLFMLTGIVDHATHTRDIDRLGGLWQHMPRTMTFFILSAASMAGLPPLLGFISKELVLDLFVEQARSFSPGWIPLLSLATSAAITAAVALKMSVGLAFIKPADAHHLEKHPPHDAPWGLLAPPALLSAAGILFGVFPNALAGALYPVGLVGLAVSDAPSYALWHGFSAPLFISAGALLAGLALFKFRSPVQRFQESFKPRRTLNALYNDFWDISLGGAKKATNVIQNGSLTRYTAVLIGFLALIGWGAVFSRPIFPVASFPLRELATFESLCILILMGSAVLVVILKDLLARIIALGAAGIIMCAFFTFRGAPDLALTGFLVEIVMFIVILLVFKQLTPEPQARLAWSQSIPRAALAGAGGLIVGLLLLVVLENPLAPSIHPYFNEFSGTLGGGLNVVNVILVDFRGFDTMGEGLVLCLAGLGVFALRRVWVTKPTRPPVPEALKRRALPASFILIRVSALCFPVILIFSLYLTLKGHNHPGGGFIGGLVCAGGLALEMLAIGRKRFLSRFGVNGRALFTTGLALAFLTGFGSLILGFPFLTSAVFPAIHFSTAGIFDIGIFLIVVGVTIEMITLLEEGEREAVGA